MKKPVALVCSTVFALSLLNPARAADEKITADKAKDLLGKLVGEAKKAADKMQEHDKGGTLWPHSKETLALSKDDYLKRAAAGLKTMDAEIKGLAEGESAVNSREYFKTHLEALKQHLSYCRQELDKLGDVENEEAFRVKQKKFDRTLVFLSDNVQLAKDEAGM